MQHRKLALAVGLAVGIGMVFPVAKAGVVDTKHNLGATSPSSGTPGVNRLNWTTDTTEVCAFCHTPHGANLDMIGAPLWNKGTSTAKNAYATYDDNNSPTYDAPTTDAPGPVSLACLTCHDGQQAIDNLMNVPGSGKLATSTSGTDAGWSFNTAAVNGVNPTVSVGGQFVAAVAPNLGTDLTNDHPIGMAYAGGLTSGATGAAWVNAVGSNFNDAAFAGICGNTSTGFFVESSGTGANVNVADCANPGSVTVAKDSKDMILYVYNSAVSAVQNIPRVECGSCHDPHNSDQALFLRNPSGTTSDGNRGSEVCLTCHIK